MYLVLSILRYERKTPMSYHVLIKRITTKIFTKLNGDKLFETPINSIIGQYIYHKQNITMIYKCFCNTTVPILSTPRSSSFVRVSMHGPRPTVDLCWDLNDSRQVKGRGLQDATELM